jgi:hypothetical protein
MRYRSKTVIYIYITILCFALLLHIIIEVFKVSLDFTLRNSDIIKNYHAYTCGYDMLTCSEAHVWWLFCIKNNQPMKLSFIVK